MFFFDYWWVRNFTEVKALRDYWSGRGIWYLPANAKTPEGGRNRRRWARTQVREGRAARGVRPADRPSWRGRLWLPSRWHLSFRDPLRQAPSPPLLTRTSTRPLRPPISVRAPRSGPTGHRS